MCELTKKCKTCDEEKSVCEFHSASNGKYNAHCKICRSANRKKRASEPAKDGTKKCSKCKIEQPYENFIKSSETLLGLSSSCKRCTKLYREIRTNQEKPEIIEKFCNECGLVKDTACFWKSALHLDGYTSNCISCIKLKKEDKKIEVEEKTCYTCKELKTSDLFYSDSSKVDRLSSNCKSCMLIRNNTEEAVQKKKEYGIANRERNARKENEKRRNNPLYKFSTNVKSLIRMAFKSACNGTYTKGSRSEEILGCTMSYFLEYLSTQFEEGMSLDNHGMCEECWHIDHIIPISFAQTEQDIYELNHYTNLRPMWGRENIRKSNMTIEEFEQWKLTR